MSQDCVFCKIIKGEIPSYKIYEDEDTLAFLDISKDCYGHTLVIPKQHFENVLDCDGEILGKVINTVKKVSNHYVNNCGFKGVNVLNASGKAAEQSVFHLHFHILPKKDVEDFHSFPNLGKCEVELSEQLENLKMK